MNSSYYEKRLVIGDTSSSLTMLMDWMIAFILSICPILQHYNGIFMEAGTEMLIFAFPFTLLRLLGKTKLYIRPILPLMLYAIYISAIHGFSAFTFAREFLLLFYFMAVLNKGLDITKYFRCAKFVGMLAAWLIIVQYLLYYIFEFHLQLVPAERLLESASQWIGLAETGRISVTGAWTSIYRPSAFFLEPSHLAIYCIPVLVINLLSADINQKKIRESTMLSIAMVLSTSGIGIMAAIATWLLYIALYYGLDEKIADGFKNKKKRSNAILYLLAVIVLIVGLYFSVGVFRSAVNRIFFSSSSGSGSAIQGRTATGIRLLHMLSGINLLIGRGSSLRIADWNVSGFFYTVFQFGWIGCALYYWFYIKGLLRFKREYFWLTMMIVGLSFFTVHTFAAFYRMFFICLILGGYLLPDKVRGGTKRYP